MEQKAKLSGRIVYVKLGSEKPQKPGEIRINIKDHPEFVGKHTKNDSGQKQFGGWETAGLQWFITLMKMNYTARNVHEVRTAQIEAKVLEQIREANGITGKD